MKTARTWFTAPACVAAVVALAATLVGATGASAQGALPERVTFPSADGATTLVGYVFRPQGPHPARMPAMVMMHGRAGAYSQLAHGVYDAATLSKRHVQWGQIWAQQGYVAILVDGFGPRGYPQGFPRHSYNTRPEALNEVTVRPLDAYGALAYLRTRADVIADRVALQGWSNGGSATLAAMADTTPARATLPRDGGFRGALAFYPACTLKGRFDDGLVPYAPVRVLIGTADEEVNPAVCAELTARSRARNGDLAITLYPGATHDFDDPGVNRRGRTANAMAWQNAAGRAIEFFARLLRG
jgi:carboxymethylenebutenolidase